MKKDRKMGDASENEIPERRNQAQLVEVKNDQLLHQTETRNTIAYSVEGPVILEMTDVHITQKSELVRNSQFELSIVIARHLEVLSMIAWENQRNLCEDQMHVLPTNKQGSILETVQMKVKVMTRIMLDRDDQNNEPIDQRIGETCQRRTENLVLIIMNPGIQMKHHHPMMTRLK